MLEERKELYWQLKDTLESAALAYGKSSDVYISLKEALQYIASDIVENERAGRVMFAQRGDLA